MHSWERDTIRENPLLLMRYSRRLGLDAEMFVPVTIAEPAGLNGEDTVKTPDYSPLELIFKKIGIYPLAPCSICLSLLLSSIFPSWDKFPNKLFRSDKGIFRAGISRARACATIWMHQMWVEGAHLCFCSGEP